jgi:plastocyanin domain-containing protein
MKASIVFFAICAVAFAACQKKADADGKQHVAVRADDKGFTPSSVALKKGTPATLTFTRTTDDTCAKEVVFPEINLRKALPLNVPTDVDVPTENARTLAFTCGMGMFKSAVVIQ